MKCNAVLLAVFYAVSVFAADETMVALEELQHDALRASPDLQSLTRRLEAARATAQQAGRWPNPELSISVDRDEQEVALTQTFDPWGKLKIARQLGFTEAEVAEAKLLSARLDLQAEIARQFWTALSTERQLNSLEEELSNLDKVLRIREGELQAGEIAATDLFNAQELVAQRKQQRWRVAEEASSARVALNTLTARPPDARLELKQPSLSLPGPTLDAREAIAQALARHPVLTQMRARLKGAGYRVLQEERRRTPDPRGGPFVRNTPEDTFVGLTVSFSLPVLDQNRAGRRAARANEAAVRDELQANELLVAQEAYLAFQLWTQKLRAFEDLNTWFEGSAVRQREMAEEAFKLGAISERDLLSARIELSKRQQELEGLRTQAGRARARLVRALVETDPRFSWTRVNLKN